MNDCLEPAYKKPFDFLAQKNHKRNKEKPVHERKTAFLKTGSPGGTRTPDQLVNSQLLYRLSYRGKEVNSGFVPYENTHFQITRSPNF